MLEILLLALAADAAPQQAQSVERVAQRGPVTVRNALALTLAMKTASPGATVVLAPGDYGQIALSDLNFGTPVTLVAKDAQTFLETGPAIRRNRGPVGLVERSFEDKRRVDLADGAGEKSNVVFTLNNARPGDERERGASPHE